MMDFWTDEKVDELTVLWNDHPEISVQEIGARLGCSKNAALGKAHRIDLVPRRGPKRAPAPSPTGRTAMEMLKASQCRYPYGHVGDPDFHFCTNRAVEYEPYCSEHHELCYITKDEQEKRSAAWTDERRAAARQSLLVRGGFNQAKKAAG